MQVTSSDFTDGDTISLEHVLSADYGFGCEGGNRSPQLSWSGAPEGTKSFVVHCYDPDAPTGSGFWHWVVVNIPPDVTELPAGAGNPGGALPDGALQTNTDFGQPGYGGPCPPEGHGQHHYQFTVFACSQEKLPVQASTPAAQVGFNLFFSTLDKATITGLFER